MFRVSRYQMKLEYFSTLLTFGNNIDSICQAYNVMLYIVLDYVGRILFHI